MRTLVDGVEPRRWRRRLSPERHSNSCGPRGASRRSPRCVETMQYDARHLCSRSNVLEDVFEEIQYSITRAQPRELKYEHSCPWSRGTMERSEPTSVRRHVQSSGMYAEGMSLRRTREGRRSEDLVRAGPGAGCRERATLECTRRPAKGPQWRPAAAPSVFTTVVRRHARVF